MIRLISCFATLLICVASAAAAQSNVEAANGQSAQLRALDIITGVVVDLDVEVGQTVDYERLTITLHECRYPVENPNADAFAHLEIKDVREEEARFAGWMIASSPALYALEHPRYDVWVLSCKTPDAASDDG